jgi:hypothetical protein
MRRVFALLLCAVAAAAALAGLAGCDAVNMKDLQPGVSTASEVRERMGRPGIEWRNADGSVTWEYSRQPEGVECFMVTIGADQRLVSIENVLTAANFARVEAGWSRDQVRRLLGAPRSRQSFPLSGEEVWDWRLPPDFSADNFFNVHFDPHGKVLRTSRSTQSRG